MVVCPICFRTRLLWPPSPLATGGLYVAPFPNIRIYWNMNMDTSVVPSESSMVVIADGFPCAISNVHWNSATELDMDFSGMPSSTLVWKLRYKDNNLRSAQGTVAKPVQTVSLYP